MRLFKFLTLLSVILLFTTCKLQKKKNENTITKKWNRKEVLFPKETVFTSLLRDTIIFEYLQAKMKILIYADTTDCMGCKLQLNKWKELMATISDVTTDTIQFLFFLYPKDIEELEYLIQSENFHHPICIDINDQLNRLNNFSSDVTFLLNEDNRVIATGNPTHDLKIRKLYLEKITDKKQFVNSIKTTAQIDRTQINFGTLKKHEVTEFVVEIKNTGKAPLVIFDINTSCGCITTSFKKQPTKPGDRTKIKLKVKPAELGFLKKTVNIRANINKTLTLSIQGNIIE